MTPLDPPPMGYAVPIGSMGYGGYGGYAGYRSPPIGYAAPPGLGYAAPPGLGYAAPLGLGFAAPPGLGYAAPPGLGYAAQVKEKKSQDVLDEIESKFPLSYFSTVTSLHSIAVACVPPACQPYNFRWPLLDVSSSGGRDRVPSEQV